MTKNNTVDLTLVCPCEKNAALVRAESSFACTLGECEHSMNGRHFPIVDGIPQIISDLKCDTICSFGSTRSFIPRPYSHLHQLKRLLMGDNRETLENCRTFVSCVTQYAGTPKVLIIGSGEKGAGTADLWNSPKIQVTGVDVYASPTTNVVCDAHYLPFPDNHFDGVWIQAVLEHVVQPDVVVNEIFRVLKVGGVVYAETPFMQQVHEGAYDFSRFTVLGHRYLFKRFSAIRIGGLGGPHIVFAWSVRYLIWSISRSKRFAQAFGVLLQIILRPLSLVISQSSMHDASSGVFFLGRKESDHRLTHKQLVSLYSGQF